MPAENENLQNAATTAGGFSNTTTTAAHSNTSSRESRDWSTIEVGNVIAQQYEIVERLGQGGMGVVFKARDIVLGRIVAIKLLQTSSGVREAKTLRFQQEARVIAALDHKNIVRLHAIATTEDGTPFFVMEYVEGRSLAEELRIEKRLPIDRAVAIFRQACDAVEHAHAKGVVHRDIKPSNLMLVTEVETGEPSVKLLDFGIAKLHGADGETIQQLTQTGELCGSPFYMSPEQSEGKRVDIRTDIYALGCVFYEMLCGAPPFKGATAVETLLLHQSADPKPLWQERSDLGSANAIDRMIMKMLAKSPDNRFASISQVRQALDQALVYQKGSLSSFIARCQANLRRKKTRRQLLVCAAFMMPVVMMWVPIAAWSYAVSIGHVPPSAMTPELFWKDWKEFDLVGQHEFNDGNYKAAEDSYRKALFKAKIDFGENRLARLKTSLMELFFLYDATGQKAEKNDVSSQLDALPPSAHDGSNAAVRAFENAEKDLEKTGSGTNLNAYLDSAAELLHLFGSQGVAKKMGPLSDRITKNVYNAVSGHHIKLSEDLMTKFALIQMYASANKDGCLKQVQLHNGEKISGRELFHRILTKVPVQQPSNKLKLFMVMLSDPERKEGLSRNDIENILLPITENGALTEKVDAWLLLGALRESENSIHDATEYFTRALDIVENSDKRDYKRLLTCLYHLGTFFEATRMPARALPYYRRCEAISTRASAVQSEMSDGIKRSLAQVYIDLGQFANAEQILLNLETVLNRNNPNGIERARTLAELGHLYCLNNDFAKGERLLLDSIEIFKSLPPATANQHDTYARAMSNLRMLYLKQGRMKEVDYWGRQVKKLDGVERVVDKS